MDIRGKQKTESRTPKVEGRTPWNFGAIALAGCLLLLSLQTNAQCAMCRAALEGENNTATAEAVNDGIVYLMAIPYLLVGVIGYYIYRTQIGKKKA